MSELPPSSIPAPSRPARWRPSRRLVIGGVLAVIALVFILQNTRRGKIDFWFWTITMPAWIWLLATFAVGVIVGSIFPWLRRSKRKGQLDAG